MNRRKFFKRFGQGTAAMVVAPTLFTSERHPHPPEEFDIKYLELRQSPVSYGGFESFKPQGQNFWCTAEYLGQLTDFHNQIELKHLFLTR